MIKGGETKEYSAHVVTIGDMRIMPKELFADGVMLAGEAANLVLNSGRAIQGMDFAMHSGVLAAETVLEAKGSGDYSARFLKRYREKLEDSYVMKDLRKFQSAVHFFHNREMFTTVPNLVNDFGRQFFSVKNAPTDKVPQMLMNAIKRHSSIWNVLKLGLKGARAL
jgi:electron transfer flavoprotein-quinone oxidoreductase